MNEYDKVFKCITLGNCYKKEYEYSFTLNNEYVKADYCHTSLFGNTYCRIDVQYYTNVTYNYKFIEETSYKNDLYLFHPYILLLIIPIIMWCVLMYFIRGGKI